MTRGEGTAEGRVHVQPLDGRVSSDGQIGKEVLLRLRCDDECNILVISRVESSLGATANDCAILEANSKGGHLFHWRVNGHVGMKGREPKTKAEEGSDDDRCPGLRDSCVTLHVPASTS